MNISRQPPAICLLGPTASGKTDLACAIADNFPVEIISLDSAQVFIDMDIGTAKPDAATLQHYPHHLINLITPEASYSAAEFRRQALACMAEISARGKVPLLVGGTMLYFKALVSGLAELPPADAALRAQIDAEAAQYGWPALHADLARHDPVSAARLAPNDAQRIQRALEVLRLTGQPLGDFWQRQHAAPLPYQLLSVGLTCAERSLLHTRIARRFQLMLDSGLVAEVAQLQRKYALNAALPAMRCVGYRQVWEMLAGALPTRELMDRGIFATRQLAKRQLTWMRALHETGHLIRLFDLAESTTAAKISAQIDAFIARQH
jgi:tRNA dimethylallyltransferase